jgi:hypothetical protein
MKAPVVFALTFVTALVGATGAKVMMTKPAPRPPAADSVASDSTKRDSTKTDSTSTDSSKAVRPDTAAVPLRPPSPPADTIAKSPVTAQAVQAVQPTQPQPQQAAQPAQTVAPISGPLDTTVRESERRLAKVFIAMDPKQAAKVLEHMSDNDVHVILGYVGPRQAASIMAALPPERVATLSKLSMQGKGK